MKIHMNRNSSKWHMDEGSVTYGFTLHLRVRDHCVGDGLWTLFCGLSQFDGHGSWPVCEVALIALPSALARLQGTICGVN